MNVIKLSLCMELDFLIFKRKNEGSQHRRLRHVTSITLWDFPFWLRCSLDWIHCFLLHNGVKMLVLPIAFIHDDVWLHLHKVLIVLVLILSNVIIIIVPVWLITNWLKFILSINTQSRILCDILRLTLPASWYASMAGSIPRASAACLMLIAPDLIDSKICLVPGSLLKNIFLHSKNKTCIKSTISLSSVAVFLWHSMRV